jgi:hypothetical protein
MTLQVTMKMTDKTSYLYTYKSKNANKCHAYENLSNHTYDARLRVCDVHQTA